ncbi:MAG TPA: class I SAM-dependent methyltransferase [Sedimentisphaerales bacterium]|jgi:SAM-dependent methyltransferase|nr:class I SAM-dependent methyltransferase [Sedimentisphaerales bacterium]HNU31902.1 class I SAM-dependent methyltransferase [Sedimentisphaerales bacterium]
MDSKEQMEFLYEVFEASLPRLGPGDEASTVKALNLLRSAGFPRGDRAILRATRILDLGCGNGAQTIPLARNTEGPILAMDNHQPFLNELLRRVEAAGLAGRVQVSRRDMRSLETSDGPFDLIWSEGALFIVGFREGLTACHSLLTPGGGLAVSELAWLRPDVPAACRQFFDTVYPAMTDMETNLATIRACGYDLVGHFVQPESAWWEPFYHPLAERLRSLRGQYAADARKLAMIEPMEMEIDMYRQYSAYYGNVFYVMRRR